MAYPNTIEAGNLTQALDYDSNRRLIYHGLAQPGTAKSAAGWQIISFTYNSNGDLTDIQWADGNFQLDNVWNDRATLSYS